MLKHRLGVFHLGEISTNFYLSELENILKKYALTEPYKIEVIETDFKEINQYLPYNYEKLIPLLKKYLRKAQKDNLETVLFPNISIHAALDILSPNINMVHPAIETLSALKKRSINEVVIWGTRHSMQLPFFQELLPDNGIQCFDVSESKREKLDNIRQEVFQFGVFSETVEHFKQLIEEDSSNQSILLCCTELSLLNAQSSPSLSVIDMAQEQINGVSKSFNISS